MAVVTGNGNKKRFTPKGNNGGDFKNRPYLFSTEVEIIKFNIANPEGAAAPWSPKAAKEGNFDSLTVKFDKDFPELGVKKGDERTVVRPRKANDSTLGIKEFSKSISGKPPLEPGDHIILEGVSDYASERYFKIGDKGIKMPEGVLVSQFFKTFEREQELEKFNGKSMAVIHHGPATFYPVYGDNKKSQRIRLFHEDKETFIDVSERAMLGTEATEEEMVAAADKNVEAVCKAFEKAFADYDYAYGTPGAMIRVFPNVSGLSKEEAIERATLNPDSFPAYYDVFSRVPFTEDENGKRTYSKLTDATVKQMTDNLRKLNEDFKVLDAKVQSGESMTEEEIERHEEAQQFQQFMDGVAIDSNLVEVIPTSTTYNGKMSLTPPPGKEYSAGHRAANKCTTVTAYPVIDDNGDPVVEEGGSAKTQDIKSNGGIVNTSIAIAVNRRWQIELEDGKTIPLPEGVKVNGSGVLVNKRDKQVAIDPKTGELAEEGITEASLSEANGGFVKTFVFDYGRNAPARAPEFLMTKGLSEKLGANGPAIEEHNRTSSMAAWKRYANEHRGQENEKQEVNAQEKKDLEQTEAASEPSMDNDEVPF